MALSLSALRECRVTAQTHTEGQSEGSGPEEAGGVLTVRAQSVGSYHFLPKFQVLLNNV